MSEDRPNIYPALFKKQTATATAAGTPGQGSWTGSDVLYFTNTTSSSGVNSGRKVIDVQDTGDLAISRIVVLHNGSKVNLSGSADADLVLGQMQFIVRCYGDHPGAADARYQELSALRGLQGTMLARVYKSTDEIYRSCLGNITTVRPTRRSGLPVTASRRSDIDVLVVFDRLTAWGNEYTVTP